MIDEAEYNASIVDWDALRRIAARAARESTLTREGPIAYVNAQGTEGTSPAQRGNRVEIVGPHWLLDRRNYHIERTTRGTNYRNQETTHEQHSYVLLLNGELKHVCIFEDEQVYTPSSGQSTFRVSREHTISDIGDDDLGVFDREKTHAQHGSHGDVTMAWGDRNPGRELLVAEKGAGLYNTLNRLLPADATVPTDIPEFGLIDALRELNPRIDEAIHTIIRDKDWDYQSASEYLLSAIRPFEDKFSTLVAAAHACIDPALRAPFIHLRDIDREIPGAKALTQALSQFIEKQAQSQRQWTDSMRTTTREMRERGEHTGGFIDRTGGVPRDLQQMIDAMDWCARSDLSTVETRGIVRSIAYPGDTYLEAKAAAVDAVGESIQHRYAQAGRSVAPRSSDHRDLAELARYKELFCAGPSPNPPHLDALKDYIEAMVLGGGATPEQCAAFERATEWNRLRARWDRPVYRQMRKTLDDEAARQEELRQWEQESRAIAEQEAEAKPKKWWRR